MQRLLGHLAEAGFTGAPGPRGLTGDQELVEYLPGEAGTDLAAPWLYEDEVLVAAARLLRGLHDAGASFVRSEQDVWLLPPREPAEVICHGDAATYNTVFRDGLPVAFIDFDTAHPGPRLWDAAYTAYRFVPLYESGGVPVAQARRRLALFAEAYGLSEQEAARLPEAVAERLHALVAFMREQAAAGHPAFAAHLARGDDRKYLADVHWVLSELSELSSP
ncbi:aminoglycoside phosphotransferase family protein [Kitasatospora viridis]|uniref:Phosphotransferase family enzyme n=1 Tax=Kitasatospora viridis TaxID=281105 RepID=A0A561TTC8_9ACTN|nr:phosphotransferase family enzyme [Kitasatospora viridis]